MSLVHRSMTFDDKSIDESARTAKIKWTTGASVLRRNWTTNPVYEELDMTREAINLSSLNDNAPLLMDHNSASVRNIVGVIEPGSAYISDKNGYATVRFGTDKDCDLIFQKVKEGLISKVSVGYSIEKTQRVRAKNKEDFDTILVTKWTPKEVSVCVFPADPGAGFRSLEEEKFELKEDLIPLENETDKRNDNEIKNDKSNQERNLVMNNVQVTVPKINEMETRMDKSSSPSVEDIVKRERERISEISKMVRLASLDDSFSSELIDGGIALEQARTLVFQKMEEAHKETRYKPAVTGGNPVESIEKRNDAIANAILNRYDSRLSGSLDESSRRFRNSSLVEIARYVTGANQFESTTEVISRALSTSDFPKLLENITGKTLRAAYAQAPKTYDPLVRKITVPDFKEIKRVQIGDVSKFQEKAENGQYKAGKFGEASESYSIKESGLMIQISRQTLINDDLGAMLRLPSMIARSAADFESETVWGEITKNAVMGDGINVFDAAHNNVAKVPAGINIQSIAAAKSAMRLQRGINGSRLNITPYYLIVSSAMEVNALQFMHATTPNNDQSTNPFKSSLTVIVEPRLDDVNPNAWYLAADLGQIDLIEMAYLQGQEGLFVDQMYDFDTDGMRMKARLDFGVKIIDHRGFFKNDGEKQSSK